MKRGGPSGLTDDQFKEAARGTRLKLSRVFSATWINENAEDLLIQANVEYAEWLEGNSPARNPVGWIINCAYWRAVSLLEKERHRPTSLEALPHVADQTEPSLEQQVLNSDRVARLHEAMAHLPDKEQKLFALVYGRGMSIRAAGREVGWQKSAADRHHRVAMEKMLAMVGDQLL